MSKQKDFKKTVKSFSDLVEYLKTLGPNDENLEKDKKEGKNPKDGKENRRVDR